MKRKLYLLLGSNLGDRFGILRRAKETLEVKLGSTSKASSCYATAAWGKTEQPDFINQVLQFDCDMEAKEVLNLLLATEEHLGRIRKEKWGPRTIDIDLLVYGTLTIDEEHLQVPHAELHNRRFTLVPLCELAPNEVHPVFNKTYMALLNDCSDSLPVRKTEALEYEV